MTKILCIAAVVILAALAAAAVLLAVAIGHAQDEIDNMKLDRDL